MGDHQISVTMCGFGGVINHKTQFAERQIADIALGVNFRGPDSCGVRILDGELKKCDNGNTAFFFNRLAIVDLDSRSDQPFEDEDHVLMFNGEIYNYAELKSRLEKQGIVFKTTSDTEVLFFALKLWGTNALRELNGMFAFFWLDKKSSSYIVARDRLGIKPLYYHSQKGAFYFSSELHSVIRMIDHVPPVSTDSVNMYLWFQFIPTPHSIFEGIKKLPPGSYISGNINEPRKAPEVKPYWDAYQYVNTSKGKALPGSLEEILRESVQRQLQADVPIGLFLSSGVDSSLLAAIVNRYFASEQNVNFFTVSFGEQTATDESSDAMSFIQGFNNPHLVNHVLEIGPSYMQTQLDTLYNYYDEPFGDYASLLNWAISQKARDYVTVAISGDGADELFWGYSRYNKWKELSRYNKVSAISKTVNKLAEVLPSGELKYKVLKGSIHDPVERHLDQFLMPGFRPYFQKGIMKYPLWALENVETIKHRQDLPGILDIKTYLADGMLYKVDRSSMATSLEVRVPYLDNKVLEYALDLDLSFKTNKQYRNKAILKELLTKLAPHYDVTRAKKGFSFPLRNWLQTRWKDQVTASITPQALNDVGLPSEPFMRLVKDFYEKKTFAQVEVWYLFNLIMWKNNIDKIRRQTSS